MALPPNEEFKWVDDQWPPPRGDEQHKWAGTVVEGVEMCLDPWCDAVRRKPN